MYYSSKYYILYKTIKKYPNAGQIEEEKAYKNEFAMHHASDF